MFHPKSWKAGQFAVIAIFFGWPACCVVGMLAKHPLCHVSDKAFRIGQGGKGVGKGPRRTAGGPTCLTDGQGQVVMRKVPIQRNTLAGYNGGKKTWQHIGQSLLSRYTFLCNIFVATAFHPLDQPTTSL